MKKAFLAGFAMFMAFHLLTFPAPAAAAIDAALDGKTKINLSGRQRMLSQRMAKAVCFAAIGVETQTHLGMLANAHKLFQRTLDGLSRGDVEQGMLPEANAEILANLDEVAALWSDYRAVNEAIIASGAVSRDQLQTVASVNLPVLKQMHKTVGIIEKVYGSSGEVHPALALALNVSGRQRMLSQKASKEFCLISGGVDVAANRAALSDTVSLFTSSLSGLINGNAADGLAPAPTREIQAQLEKVEGMWTPLREVLLRAANGGAPSAADIEKVSTENNPLLVEMNKAVFMYNSL